MMHSKVMILLWERWQRTRWAVIAACLLPLTGRLMYVTGYYPTLVLQRYFVLLGFVLLTFVLLVGHCESRDVDLAFPKRLFRLPIRTTTLFTVYIGYGVAAVALQALIFMGFEGLFFEQTSVGWTTFLKYETVYIILQTLSWLAGSARFLFLALWLAGMYALHFFTIRLNLLMDTNILRLIIILLCCFISFWNVTTYRHGAGLNNWQWLDTFLGMFRKRPSKPFASALHAQIWFESRQTGYLFPLAALCLIGLLLGYVVGLEVYDKLFVIMALAFPAMLAITILAAFFTGLLILAVYNRDHVSGASIFWLRRPISTQSLAVARMHAMAWSLARVLAILTVVMLAAVAHDYLAFGIQDPKALSPMLSPVKWAMKYSSPLEVVTMTILGLYGFVIFYWTILRLGLPLLVGGIAVLFISRLISLLIGDVALSWAWNILVVGLPMTVLAAFYVARHRNLITTTTLVIAVCMFPVAVVSLWAFPWWQVASGLPKGLPDLNPTQIIRLISAATLPFIPIVATPLIMDRLRHR